MFSLTHTGPTAPARPWNFRQESMHSAITYYRAVNTSAPFVIINVQAAR
jgi:hypothetical protein